MLKNESYNLKKKSLASLICATGLAASGAAHSVLPSNAILTMDQGSGSTDFPLPTGSSFGMEVAPGFIIGIGLESFNGVKLGVIQGASGSHVGPPDGSESPDIDLPWSFFGNTGMHQTVTTAPTILSDDGAGNVTLDFSGWGVTWNTIDNIPMGSGAHSGGVDGVAAMTCAADCSVGDTYTLEYYATVPPGDPSNFGGVQYSLLLKGTIFVPEVPVSDPGTVLSAGPVSALGSNDGLATQEDLDAAGIARDTGWNNVGGYFDFIVTGVAAPTVNVVLSLTTTLPNNAVYRKWTGVGWVPFLADGTNLIASTTRVGGACPAPGDAAYNHNNGLVIGDDCIQLTLEDGGQYDWDANVGTVYDPGGVATAQEDSIITIAPSGTDGCSISSTPVRLVDRASWLLIAGFIALLGIRRIRSRT